MRYIKFLCLICTFFTELVLAQTPQVNSAGIKPVAIGQMVPDVHFDVVNSKKIISLSELRGRAVIIDFWATYCGPCIGMFPKLKELKDRFAGQLEIISVSSEDEETVTAFLQRYPKLEVFSVRDTSGIVNKLFPHFAIPHYVWIDNEGIVRAITGHKSINSENVQALVNKNALELALKQDSIAPFDIFKPLLIDGNGGQSSKMIRHSLLTAYDPGLPPLMMTAGKGENRIILTNVSIKQLFQLAFSNRGSIIWNEQTVLDVSDPTKYDYDSNRPGNENWNSWAPAHLYSYELIVPQYQADSINEIMRGELTQIFGLKAHVEKRKTKVWILTSVKKEMLATKGGIPKVSSDIFGLTLKNSPLSELQFPLKKYIQQSTGMPILFDIDINQKVDLNIKAKLTNVLDVRRELNKYGLDLQQAEREIDILVITDTLK